MLHQESNAVLFRLNRERLGNLNRFNAAHIEFIPAGGAIILSKALNDEGLMGRQTRLYRNHIKLLFGGKPSSS